MERSMSLVINGETYEGTLARITKTILGPEDHGIFTAQVYLEWGGSGTAIGGHYFGVVDAGEGKWFPNQYGLNWIAGVMYAAGVRCWEDLRGREIVMLHPAGTGYNRAGMNAVGVAHPIDDRSFLFQDIKDLPEYGPRPGKSVPEGDFF